MLNYREPQTGCTLRSRDADQTLFLSSKEIKHVVHLFCKFKQNHDSCSNHIVKHPYTKRHRDDVEMQRRIMKQTYDNDNE